MEYNFDFSKYTVDDQYYRNGRRCLFDPVRKILVVRTPEEIIRQKVIKYLVECLEVPIEKIDIEVPMSYFQKGAKGRADIIVYGNENCSGEVFPLILIECKAPEVPLTEDVWDQVFKYDRILQADILIITNGEQIFATTWDDDRKDYFLLYDIPKYEVLLSGTEFVYIDFDSNEKWQRPKFSLLDSENIMQEFVDYGWIGEDTKKELFPLIINLAGFLQDGDTKISPFYGKDFGIVEDGHRYTSFGNSAGGIWVGQYRYLIIEDSTKNNQIISISIFGSNKYINDPIFGNRKGHTTLVVAIDDFERRHNSLQLNIDKFTTIDEKKFILWHDGALTLGNKGAMKRQEVINYIKEKDPSLIGSDDRIILGVFDKEEEITWEQEGTQNFICNLIRYAILRDKFRDLHRK